MDLSFIEERLDNVYYRTIESVKNDLKLIRDNCFKYNLPDSEVSFNADSLF